MEDLSSVQLMSNEKGLIPGFFFVIFLVLLGTVRTSVAAEKES